MKRAKLVFPHQLFKPNPLEKNEGPFVLVEEELFFNQYAFHKVKLAFHRASMKEYAAYLKAVGEQVIYIEAGDERSAVRNLVRWLSKEGAETISLIEASDDWLESRIEDSAESYGIELQTVDSPQFLNTRDDLSTFFRGDKKKFFQTTFYQNERKRLGILLDDDGGPAGGKWTYDSDNRKPYPKSKRPPSVNTPGLLDSHLEAVEYVNRLFPDNPGEVTHVQIYPLTHEQAWEWLEQFLEERFDEFGPYEDAIVSNETVLNHSVISPMLNSGLLTPRDLIDRVLEYASDNEIRMNSAEGFVRQVIGWREFIRGVYLAKGRQERTRNFWKFTRKIPRSFYDGTTGIVPLDDTIGKVLKTGYCHHIERLMILGNFMLLCEFDPDDVYRWFMELFIDAYDWVMVPNVYGMSQYADGGLMSTKPYISGSNYILKMSDYSKGDWSVVWDGLFWRFMDRHREILGSNPRTRMLLSTLDRMSSETRRSHLLNAERYLEELD